MTILFPESKVTEIYCMADDFCKGIFVTNHNGDDFKNQTPQRYGGAGRRGCVMAGRGALRAVIYA